jgi:hypothetical protein
MVSNELLQEAADPGMNHRLNNDDVCDMARELKARREVDRWVPVGENIPNHGQKVICNGYWGVTYAECYIDFDNKLKFGNPRGGCGNILGVTHWRNLPAPPDGYKVLAVE